MTGRVQAGTRRVAACVAACVALCVLAGASAATTLTRPDGTPWGGSWQAWADQAQLPTPAGPLVLYPNTACPSYPGQAVACLAPDAIYVPRARDRRLMLLHELGHAMEAQLDDDERAAFMRLYQLPAGPWQQYGPAGALDAGYALSPNEVWARVYASCASGRGSWPGVCRWALRAVSSK